MQNQQPARNQRGSRQGNHAPQDSQQSSCAQPSNRQGNKPDSQQGNRWGILILVGLVAGLFSGMFGIGGGILIVPALTMLAGFGQKLASGTSLAAIVPLSLVGVSSYATSGNLSLVGAILIALGALGGAQIGTWLLDRLPVRILKLIFSLFIVVAIVSLFLVVPSRDAILAITWLSALALIVLGVAVGILSGLLGIGGGAIVVPSLMLLFGVSDLVAKGTSLLMMLPTALSGTWGNWRHGNVNLKAAIAIGLPACVTTTLGAWVAHLIPPLTGNILFAVFLAFVALRMFLEAVRKDKK